MVKKEIISGIPPAAKPKIVPLIVVISLVVILAILWGINFWFSGFKSSRSAYVLGTMVEVTVSGPGAGEHAKAALAELKRIDQLLNRYNPASEVSKINTLAGITPVAVSWDTFDVISRSVRLARSLNNTFDITVGPLMDLWDFQGKEHKKLPDPEDMAKALQLVDYRLVELNPEGRTVYLPKPGMKIDLGGVGKGYAVAKARELLVKRGVKSALINAISSIAVIGQRPDGKPWRVGIQHPRSSKELLGVVELGPGQALATSGDYHRFFESAGRRYHHILDPRTGDPATLCQSVTVITDNATTADILSTAVFVMGPSEGMHLVESLEGVEAVIVTADGGVLTSAGLELKK